MIVTMPEISSYVSPIGQNIAIPNFFNWKRPDHNCKSCGQHDYSYYQPQPSIHNHRQKYHNGRRIQQDSSKNDYDRHKGVSHGMIHGGITTPEKHKTPIITLENDSYSRKKPPTDSSSTFLGCKIYLIARVTINIKGLISFLYWSWI